MVPTGDCRSRGRVGASKPAIEAARLAEAMGGDDALAEWAIGSSLIPILVQYGEEGRSLGNGLRYVTGTATGNPAKRTSSSVTTAEGLSARLVTAPSMR